MPSLPAAVSDSVVPRDLRAGAAGPSMEYVGRFRAIVPPTKTGTAIPIFRTLTSRWISASDPGRYSGL